MDNELPAHWLSEIVIKIAKRKSSKITLATGKTPSGHIHIGILREIIICDAVRRIFEEAGKKVNFILFLDDLDAAKRFPKYITKKFQEKHLGKPFAYVPCPYKNCECKSYAYHFGNELISTCQDFGIENKIIWTHKLYKEKEMQEKIRIALENTDKIKEILKKYILPTLDEEKKGKFLEMQKTWMPVMAICENCQKIQTKGKNDSILPNRVKSYHKKDKKVEYECPACGYRGKVSIYSGSLKLNWRVDWPAKWSMYKTTCEPAGKDHSVKGGAYDTGLEICKKIFNYEGPIKVPYEWLRLGERDMKTSKGIVFTPKKYLEVADPEIFRMLILRTNPLKHISFRIEEISQYNDYYNNMEDIFYSSEVPEPKDEKKLVDFVYPLTKINPVPEKKPKKLPLNLLIFLSQMQNILSLEKLYKKAMSTYGNTHNILSIEDFEILLKRTENWLKEVKKIIEDQRNEKIKRSIMQKISLFNIPINIKNHLIEDLSEKQIKGIAILREFFLGNQNLEAEEIQNKIFSIAKEELKISPKKMFKAIYQIILGQKYGPRLGPFLSLLDKKWVLKRLKI